MQKTKIPWVRNTDNKTPGYTINPQTGCFGPDCMGPCPYCYAKRESAGRCHWQDLKGVPIAPGHDNESFYPRIHNKRLSDLQHAPSGAGIFVDDRADWCASYWPDNIPTAIIKIARLRPDIRLYLLTKQPRNLPKFSPFPPNCWVGVSATNYKMAAAARWLLFIIEAKVKFLSVEPMLGPLEDNRRRTFRFDGGDINWIILGSQTKPTIQPTKKWVTDILESADRSGIPIFVKEPLASYMNIHREEMPK